MRGFILILHGRVLPESFRFTREACRGVTATWMGDDGRFHAFAYWRKKGYRVRNAWLEVV